MLLRLAAWLEWPTRWIEPLLTGLLLAMVALMFGLVAARYLFAFGSIGGQELVLWLHSLVFMLGAAVTLRAGKHVRVDVFSQHWSPRRRALADFLGMLLLAIPFALFMGWISLDYVQASWAMREGSREPGGLPAQYLLKGLIPLAALLLLLQGVAECLRSFAAWRGASE